MPRVAQSRRSFAQARSASYQAAARANYLAARSMLTPGQALVFERIVLAGTSIGDGVRGKRATRLMSTFRMIIDQLDREFGDLVAEMTS